MNRLAIYATAFGLAIFAGDASACTTPSGVNAMASQIAAGLNANRQAAGLQPLRFNRALGAAAQGHACDMSRRGFFGHAGSNGSDAAGRAKAAGHGGCMVGENLAWGYPKATQIVNGWMASTGHRTNMLLPTVTEFGVGITQGAKGPNWVLVVGRDC